MDEKVMFPRPTDWKVARLIQRDEAYVVQSGYNEQTKSFEHERVIDIKTNKCPQLQAFILYCEIFCETVCKRLRKREDYAEWLEENKIEQEDHNDRHKRI